MQVPFRVVNEADIAKVVEDVARKLAPDVVHIRYNFGSDWTGDPSIYFRVLLSDDASREKRLGKVARRVESQVRSALNPAELGRFAYFSFRSKSEQASLREKEWA